MAARTVPLRPLAGVTAWSIVAAVAIGFLYYGRAVLIPLAVAILMWHLINALAGFHHRLALGDRRLLFGLAAGKLLALPVDHRIVALVPELDVVADVAGAAGAHRLW